MREALIQKENMFYEFTSGDVSPPSPADSPVPRALLSGWAHVLRAFNHILFLLPPHLLPELLLILCTLELPDPSPPSRWILCVPQSSVLPPFRKLSQILFMHSGNTQFFHPLHSYDADLSVTPLWYYLHTSLSYKYNKIKRREEVTNHSGGL